jgi:hypothetical protein
MPFKGTLKTGKPYKIAVSSRAGTPGITAVAMAWVPMPDVTPVAPIVEAVSPGMRIQREGTVPAAQLLLLDLDLPDAPAANVIITVEQDGAMIAGGTETADSNWTFLVKP